MLEDGSYELHIPYADPRERVMDILKHGAEVKIIEPEALRQLVQTQLQQAWRQYEK